MAQPKICAALSAQVRLQGVLLSVVGQRQDWPMAHCCLQQLSLQRLQLQKFLACGEVPPDSPARGLLESPLLLLPLLLLLLLLVVVVVVAAAALAVYCW